MRSSASSTAQIKAGDKLTGRYYQASGPAAVQAAALAAAATASNAAEAKSAHDEAKRLGRLAELERRVAANPANEEPWLLFALQHIDFGAVESMQGMPSEPCAVGMLDTCSPFPTAGVDLQLCSVREIDDVVSTPIITRVYILLLCVLKLLRYIPDVQSLQRVSWVS